MTTRLVYLITSLQVGGAEVGMLRILKQLHPDEFEVTVVALTGGELESSLPEHVDVYRLIPGTSMEVTDTIRGVKEISQADTLVCSLFHAVVIGTLLDIIVGVPNLLIWQHSTTYFGRYRPYLFDYCYSRADTVLADSEAVTEMLVERGVPKPQIQTIPLAGINLDRFRPRYRNEAGAYTCHIATIGRLVPEKGYNTLLECAEQFDNEVEFHIAGEGPLKQEITEKIESRDIDNVILHGEVPMDEIPEFLAQADIYVQPSLSEGLCITVIEAMAAGLPVIGSDTGGISNSVVHNRTGYLVKPGDVDEFTDRIQHLYNCPEVRKEFGQRGRSRVRTHYSEESIGREFRSVVLNYNKETD